MNCEKLRAICSKNVFLDLLKDVLMVTTDQFREMALSFAGAETIPHFERIGFRVIHKRMFATYLAADHTANIFLRPGEQQVFCKMAPNHIYPVPGKWGEKGATTFVLNRVPKEFVMEALLSAYNDVMKKK